ncbi:MAG: HepT-like ribonuclease domain-containing protein [Actinomycetota bacterium]
MPLRDERFFLEDIRTAIDRIASYASPGRDHFMSSNETQDAVVRNLEIIGEASKRLSADTQARAPEVPWTAIAGTRDRLIHGYFAVNLELVWQTTERDMPTLRRAVEMMLEEE